ncbi:TPA: hypothetical protein ACH3X1_006371 [Trebouxia sp. C0004]
MYHRETRTTSLTEYCKLTWLTWKLQRDPTLKAAVKSQAEVKRQHQGAGSVIKQIGAAPKYYGLFNGGVNTAVTEKPTKQYRQVQVSVRPREAAREAFTDSMLGMTGTISALVHDNLTDGSSADDQLEFMQDKCAQAAELLGLHKKARQVHPREYIAGNKRVMSVALTTQKQQWLLQTEQPRAIDASTDDGFTRFETGQTSTHGTNECSNSNAALMIVMASKNYTA